ncbi:putative alpha-glucan, water dikinase [Helianthus anomalus]
MMEEWHQKLHNNTSSDDVVICEETDRCLILFEWIRSRKKDKLEYIDDPKTITVVDQQEIVTGMGPTRPPMLLGVT